MHYSFTLFIVEDGKNSERAHKNLKRLCEKWLAGRHTITVVDVVEDFQTALEHDILLTPSVIVTEPEPQVTLYGDLSDSNKFVDALNIDIEGERDE